MEFLMYFPYMRGKQYEWIALRELSELISKNKHIIPIIEPVKKNFSSSIRSLEKFEKDEMPFILIINPTVGEFHNENRLLLREIRNQNFEENDKAHVAFVISTSTNLYEVEDFFNRFQDYNICLIHTFNFPHSTDVYSLIQRSNNFKFNILSGTSTSRYRRKFKRLNNVKVEDGFNKQKNELYPPEEFFSDLPFVYDDEGYSGFGDYLIVGDDYSATGGPAYAVAIHITFVKQDEEEEEIWVKHFVSDTTGTPVDPAGKFYEALEKLVIYLNEPDCEIFRSDVIEEFVELYNRQHFPGLGYVKKLSMKHHIELISSEVL
jgi:hypothetical protein